jgi:regulator of protease activity HflC (stomatin/prohibitin superfamily)
MTMKERPGLTEVRTGIYVSAARVQDATPTPEYVAAVEKQARTPALKRFLKAVLQEERERLATA